MRSGKESNMQDVWQDALRQLRNDLRDRDVQSWIQPLVPVAFDHKGLNHKGLDHKGLDHKGLDHKALVVRAPHTDFARFVNDRFGAAIQDAVERAAGAPTTLHIIGADQAGGFESVELNADSKNAPGHSAPGHSAPGHSAPGQLPLLLGADGVEIASGLTAMSADGASALTSSHAEPSPMLALDLPSGSPRSAASSRFGEGRLSQVVTPARDPGFEPDLQPDYTFENFVVGSSNQFASAACMAAAERPAKSFNPLFIYGGTGLGKTHLLHAIGNHIRVRYPTHRIKYISSEQYINELIQCIRLDRMDEFRYRYRTECDVLLVDDVQFFAGKDRTQYEFFHTFNTLYNSHRQIVVTSDRAPHEVPDLEERLRTRFEWGLIADVQPPEVETRVAILEKKAEAERIILPDDVCMFLATQIKSNVRVLEGSLIRLNAYASLTKQNVTIALARDVLGDVLNEQGRVVTVEQIAKTVASYFNVKIADLKGPRRHKVITRPRMVSMYLCRQLTEDSYPEIGRWFGGRDHSTVINAVTKVSKLVEKDPQIQKAVRDLRAQLDSR